MFQHTGHGCPEPFAPRAIALACALYAVSLAAAAQDTAQNPAPEATQQVVVTGMRASLARAQDIKRRADQVVDSVVADDIGKLPDANVAEALQRITGVQISRDRGEGDRVQIRGLAQTQTLLNGRSIFTAGKERGLSFQDVPAELLAGADVYKTPTADQVEGGIGGLIDLRTRRPFDFAGARVAGTAKRTYADYARADNLEGSVLMSNRWKAGGGEMGALVSFAHQKRNYRSDTQELNAPAQLADGSKVYAPSGAWHSYELGQRERTGITTSLQWRPSRQLELTLDGNYTKLATETNIYGMYASPYWPNWTAETNAGALWPKGDVTSAGGRVVKGTFWSADMSTSGSVGDNDTRTRQLALGGRWKGEDWTFRSELGATRSDFQRQYQEVRLGAYTNDAAFAYDLTTPLPSAYPVLANPNDLLTPAQYWASKAVYFRQQNEGRETVWRGDAERALEAGPLVRLRTGVRLSDRRADSAEINTIDDLWSPDAPGPVAGAAPGLASQIAPIPYSDLLHTQGAGTVPRQWLSIGNLDWLRSVESSRGALGLGVPAFDAGQTFTFSEKTQALYGMTDFESDLLGKTLSGNLGLRWVHTRSSRAWQQASGTGYTPRQDSSSDNDLLPSLNAKLDLSDKLVARVAASKVITRPNFDQLTPSLSLNTNSRTGYLGNPALEPLSARQFDTTLEYYINRSDYVFGAAFYKKVDGFIQTTASQLNYGGTDYTVSTPTNGKDGTIKGVELGYQGFFTSLPGVLRGLGLQANFTYVDSRAPGPLQGQDTQLENLSRRSFNVVAMYDYQDFALRLAYNHRSSYLAGTTNYYPNDGKSIAQTPVYMNGYGMVDAYMSYALSKTLKIAVEGSNLTRTARRSSFGVSGLPYGRYVDDRRYAVSLYLTL